MNLQQSIDDYLQAVSDSRSENTYIAYKWAMVHFVEASGLSPTLDLSAMRKADNGQIYAAVEDGFAPWLTSLAKDYSPATAKLKIAGVAGWVLYISANEYSSVNVARFQEMVKRRSKGIGERLMGTEDYSHLDRLVEAFRNAPVPTDPLEGLLHMRDFALIQLLMDSGMRISEACKINWGDVNMNTHRLMVIGKGDKQRVVFFSNDAAHAMTAYRELIPIVEPKRWASRIPIRNRPVLLSHSNRNSDHFGHLDTATGWQIVRARAEQFLPKEDSEKVHPHAFRHRFVTKVAMSGNLKLAQELAGHANISVTQRYAHVTKGELDDTYNAIFNKGAKNPQEVRKLLEKRP